MKALFHKLAGITVINRTFHTVWQAAVGVAIAAIVGAHGDMRVALTLAGAGVGAAVKNAIVTSLEAPAPAAPPAV